MAQITVRLKKFAVENSSVDVIIHGHNGRKIRVCEFEPFDATRYLISSEPSDTNRLNNAAVTEMCQLYIEGGCIKKLSYVYGVEYADVLYAWVSEGQVRIRNMGQDHLTDRKTALLVFDGVKSFWNEFVAGKNYYELLAEDHHKTYTDEG